MKSILADARYENQSLVETLKKKCDYVESRINSIFSFPSSANAIVSKLLINSNFWKTNDDSGYDILPQSLLPSGGSEEARSTRRPSHSGRHTLHSYLRALQLGAPNELQSDECLSELLVNESENEFDTAVPDGELLHPKPLLLSRECSNAMSLRRKSYGYHLTHKLLFYLILGKQQFSNIQQEFFTTAKDKLCEQILRESQLIADLAYPEIFRDLFMEQVFLCAYVGYAEFRNQSWLSEIVSWQNDAGCFKYRQDADREGANALTTECSTHMTGVGAAVLGLFARLQLIG
ncbi:AAEL001730-PA [Aedes aegypti]|nr:AAEL001730-PA [Aedes aegypti]